MRHRFHPALLAAALLLAAAPAWSQINLELKLDRTLYVAHEPITGELTIVNLAGRDLIFGESGGINWLDFSVTDGRGNLITPVGGQPNERPIVLGAGQSHKLKVVINRRYPMSNIGTYRVKASVHFPQINRVFEAKPVTVQVTDGQPLWSQIVGVPQGHPDAGTYREFALMTYYHGARSRALYFRLRDNTSGMVFRTFSLGDFLALRPPTQMIDSGNQLHILHMTSPQAYRYTVINIDGEPVRQQTLYEKGANRPQLKNSGYGEVSVVGGLTEEQAKTPYEQQEFPRLSDRPPGLPNL
jgi:hypothetical protein